MEKAKFAYVTSRCESHTVCLACSLRTYSARTKHETHPCTDACHARPWWMRDFSSDQGAECQDGLRCEMRELDDRRML